jgi:WD40 repeat protein
LGLVSTVAFLPEGKLLLSSYDYTAKLSDGGLGVALQTLKVYLEKANIVDLPDNKLLALVSSHRTVKLWDASLEVVLQTLKGYLGSVTAVAFLLDSKLLASASDDRAVKL